MTRPRLAVNRQPSTLNRRVFVLQPTVNCQPSTVRVDTPVKSLLRRILSFESPASPWETDGIIRAELFSIERLEQHAASLAEAQSVTRAPPARRSLNARLSENESALLGAYRAIAAAVGDGRAITPAAGRVIEGYAVLQPRVTPSLPIGREGSLFQRVFSSMTGIDPYAAAVSDVYQDLFGEGSYAGKGIYDVDAFEAALAERVPEGSLLNTGTHATIDSGETESGAELCHAPLRTLCSRTRR